MIEYVVFALLAIALYLYLDKSSNYWKLRNVPFVRPLPILGNLKPLMFLEKSPGHFTGDLYNAPEAAGQRFLGIFIFNNEPALLVRDPELIKNILVKDFHHFFNRNVECDEKCDPVGYNNLFCLRGPKWKYLRSQLSPTFTSGKMKQMFLLIKETADELLQFLENGLEKRDGKLSVVLEAKSTLARYTIDVISSCAFGLRSNAIKSAHSEFQIFGDKIFTMTIKRSLEVRAFFFMHWMAKTFKFCFLQRESTRFFRQVFWETLQERERSGAVRNDFIDVLIKLKNEQARILESSAETGDEIFETLRKYPPMPFIDRICTMDYKIPESDVIIRKGTPVFISLYKGIHHDEAHFPMPEKYDPERFSEENKASRHPFSFIPFGEGPHVCIGKRFGLMNVKTALSRILLKFRVEICEKTEIPLEIDNRAIILTAKNGIHLKFVPL